MDAEINSAGREILRGSMYPTQLRINPCVYIMSNEKHGTIYIGVTNNILRRSWEHAEGESPSFTQRYELNRLVYYQHFDTMIEAIAEEKRLKRWHREWKINLIEKRNPEWKDLFDELT